ncbi:MAG: GNAT family protein, partial [Chloroflexota bacterium]
LGLMCNAKTFIGNIIWFTEKVVNNPYVFKIIANGRFVGYIGLKNYSSGQEDVEFFIVIGALDQWGKGIGKAAMKRLIDLAKTDLGLKKIIGLVLGNNKRALRFYQRIGFQVVGQEPPSFWRDGQKYQLVRIEMLLNHPSP